MTGWRGVLRSAAVLSFGIALFQAVVTTSPKWSRYFGAWEFVASNLPLLYATGFAVALILTLFGLYALSGAGYVPRLPLLRTGLICIGAVYTLRGLFLVLELLMNAGYLQAVAQIPTRELVSSAVSLLVGLTYLAGTVGYWKQLPRPAR
jgi:hypothetical protein